MVVLARRVLVLFAVVAAISVTTIAAPPPPIAGVASVQPAAAQPPTIDQVNADLGMGVNLGNALEAPREGEWGLTLRPEYFSAIAQRGFDHVRVPIRFSAYTTLTSPYTITDGVDPTVPNADNLWQRIDWVIANAEANGLYVILDLHHFHELSDNVAAERARFLAIWDQIAQRYAGAGPLVLFELLNEPRGQFIDDPSLLNDLIADALAVIRITNPTRPVLVGPANNNSLYFLDELVLPDDPNLIASIHFYEPFEFTHQGASWIEPTPPPLTSFEPDLIAHGTGWGDWSWSTTTIPTVNGLRVLFDKQWAGLAFGRPDLVDPASVAVTISGAAELAVRCQAVDGTEIEVTRVFTSVEANTYTFDLTSCPDQSRTINFMVRSDVVDPPLELLVSDALFCDSAGACEPMLERASAAIDSAFEAAYQWSLANGIPINVGEFGSYSANGQAALADRVEWTAMVAQAARNRGFSMSYWEFGAGFGVYDRTTDTWIEPLVQALGVEPAEPGGPGEPPFCTLAFSDVPTDAYFHDAVEWAACAGITSGTSPTVFGPHEPVTRAQMATLLWRYGGSLPGGAHDFVDVPTGSYYEPAVRWLVSTAITTGTSPTTFSPNEHVTRAQMATFLWRFSGMPEAPPPSFTDVLAGSYFEVPVGWMTAQAITTGTSPSTFEPHRVLTRAQAVTFLWRHVGRP